MYNIITIGKYVDILQFCSNAILGKLQSTLILVRKKEFRKKTLTHVKKSVVNVNSAYRELDASMGGNRNRECITEIPLQVS